MTKTFKTTAVLVAMVLFVTGCATLFSETSQMVKFESTPSGAEVYIDGNLVGKTPIEVNLEKQTFKNYQLRIQKDGYLTHQQRVAKGLNKTALFNLTGLSSWGTDALTGAMIVFSPDNYYIELAPQTGFRNSDELNNANARIFATSNHLALKQEIAQGGGENLSALGKLYGLTSEQQNQFEMTLKQDAEIVLAINQATLFINKLDESAAAVR